VGPVGSGAADAAPSVAPPLPNGTKAPYNELFDPANYPSVDLSDIRNPNSVRLGVKASSISYVEASISANPADPRIDKNPRIVTRGKPCAGGPNATTLRRCRKAFDTLTHSVPNTAWVDQFQMQTTLKARYLVVTMAHRAWVLEPSSKDSMKGFGLIDTPTEAAWVVRSTAIRAEKGGFAYLERKVIKECPMEFQNRAMFISNAGVITVKTEGPIEATGICT
jgi:hypothetical protein